MGRAVEIIARPCAAWKALPVRVRQREMRHGMRALSAARVWLHNWLCLALQVQSTLHILNACPKGKLDVLTVCREWIQAQIAASDKAQISVLYASAYGKHCCPRSGHLQGHHQSRLVKTPCFTSRWPFARAFARLLHYQERCISTECVLIDLSSKPACLA